MAFPPPPRPLFLVDGNNVMGQRVGWHRDRCGARRRLVSELDRLRQRRGIDVLVVFDGSDPDSLEGSEGGERPVGIEDVSGPDPSLGVVFAGPGSDADTRMVELARSASDVSRVVAVTSDRDLARRLRELGVRQMRSGELRRSLDG